MPQLHGFQIKEVVLMSSPVVLITGALTGIGRATALAFANDGARVVVSGRHDDEGQKLATELRNLGTEAEFVRTDVRHEEEARVSSTRSSLVSVASTLPSITPEPWALPVRQPM
jgi:NAD(P)-dependent dehydrogenase (short-subunit alcohol dehydrogenase family)